MGLDWAYSRLHAGPGKCLIEALYGGAIFSLLSKGYLLPEAFLGRIKFKRQRICNETYQLIEKEIF